MPKRQISLKLLILCLILLITTFIFAQKSIFAAPTKPVCYTINPTVTAKLYNPQSPWDYNSYTILPAGSVSPSIRVTNLPARNPCTGQNSYPAGVQITLSAGDNDNYNFFQWIGKIPWKIVDQDLHSSLYVDYTGKPMNEYYSVSGAFKSYVTFKLEDNIIDEVDDIGTTTINAEAVFFGKDPGIPIVKRFPVNGPHDTSINYTTGNPIKFSCGVEAVEVSNNRCHNPESAQDIFGPAGIPIVAAQDGKISFYSNSEGGNSVKIVDANNWEHYYTHLDVVCREGIPEDMSDGNSAVLNDTTPDDIPDTDRMTDYPFWDTEVLGRNGNNGGEGGLGSYFFLGIPDNNTTGDECDNYILEGDFVTAGTLIGFLGRDGTAKENGSVPHLHYGIFDDEEPHIVVPPNGSCSIMQPYGLISKYEAASCNPIERSAPTETPTPLTPTADQAFELVDRSIDFSWNAVEGADSYKIELEVKNGLFSWASWGEYSSPTNTLTVDLLSNTTLLSYLSVNTEFRWKVSASNYSMWGSPSAYSKFTYKFEPEVPTNLSTKVTTTAVIFTWDNVQLFSDFPIQYEIILEKPALVGWTLVQTYHHNSNYGTNCFLKCTMEIHPAKSKYRWNVKATIMTPGNTLLTSSEPSAWKEFDSNNVTVGCLSPGPIASGTTDIPNPQNLGDCLTPGSFASMFYNKPASLQKISSIDFNTATPAYYDETGIINYTWASNPYAEISDDNFAVIYRGKVNFDKGQYLFSSLQEDGVRVYIDDSVTPIIDQWEGKTDAASTALYAFPTTGIHTVTVKYYDVRGEAKLNVNWTKTCDAATGEFCVNYFNNKTLTGAPAYATSEASTKLPIGNGISHVWLGSPATGVDANAFSATWQGNVNFEAKIYNFTVSGDDGIRLYVDGELLIDGWSTREPSLSQSKQMTAGEHAIKVEYFDGSGAAKAEFYWNTAPTITNKNTASKFSATNATYIHYITSSDLEGDNLTYSLVNPPFGITIDASGKLVWPQALTGLRDIVIEVSDGQLKDTETISINVLTAHGADQHDNQAIVGQTRQVSFSIYNSTPGSINLNISSVTLVSGDTGQLSISQDNCTNASLPPSNGSINCRIYLNFSPTQLGTRTVLIKIVSNGTNSPFYIAVVGEGVNSINTINGFSNESSSDQQAIEEVPIGLNMDAIVEEKKR
jgi:hypothetical protein